MNIDRIQTKDVLFCYLQMHLLQSADSALEENGQVEILSQKQRAQ